MSVPIMPQKPNLQQSTKSSVITTMKQRRKKFILTSKTQWIIKVTDEDNKAQNSTKEERESYSNGWYIAV